MGGRGAQQPVGLEQAQGSKWGHINHSASTRAQLPTARASPPEGFVVVHANIAPGSGIIVPAGKVLGKVKFFFGYG
jgi:hypothetical protein